MIFNKAALKRPFLLVYLSYINSVFHISWILFMKIFKYLGYFLLLLLLVVFLAVLFIPNPFRMMAPAYFGFEEIAPQVFVAPKTDPKIRENALKEIKAAEKIVFDFYGTLMPRPNIILCPDRACDDVFGKRGGRGVAYGKRVIRVNEKGINSVILSHELMHTNLKARVGEWRTFFAGVPAWFDEGLAVFISKDQRFEATYPEEALKDLQTYDGWWQWGDMMKRHGWKAAYGGSQQLVKRLYDKVGKAGILLLIKRLEQGMSFDEALKAVKG